MTRRKVVVDVESTGLDFDRHVAVEVAWHDLATGHGSTFVPAHSWLDRWRADPKALAINGYAERLRRAPRDRGPEVRLLYEFLDGATLVGSNPSFDARMLAKVFRRYGWPRTACTPWHHRLLDVSAYGMGHLELDDPPGLAALCIELGVLGPDHTAAGDVRATVECLTRMGLRS